MKKLDFSWIPDMLRTTKKIKIPGTDFLVILSTIYLQKIRNWTSCLPELEVMSFLRTEELVSGGEKNTRISLIGDDCIIIIYLQSSAVQYPGWHYVPIYIGT